MIEAYPYEVQERAAIYEYEDGMEREEAELKAIKELQMTIPKKYESIQPIANRDLNQ